MQIPSDIYATPKITAIFIFKLFIKVSSCVDIIHEGSTPTG
jgi:hypothetical protein